MQGGAGRIGEGDADGGVLRAQEGGRAGQCAPGAGGADETVDAASGLVPDLRACSLEMGAAVGGVVELVGVEGPVGLALIQLGGEAAREMDEMVGAGEGGRIDLDQAGAVQADGLLLFLALAARHDDDDGMAERGADEGQADAGIARRAFHDRAAGPQGAGGLRVEDQAARGAVLHRSARVEKLCLAQDLAARCGGRRAQADHRRGADQGKNIGGDRHGEVLHLNDPAFRISLVGREGRFALVTRAKCGVTVRPGAPEGPALSCLGESFR